MRIRLVLAVAGAVTVCVALSSCGGGSSSPLDNALAYLPKDAPAVVAVSTDLDSGSFHDLNVALERFGVQGGLEGALDDQLGQGAPVSFTDTIKPLLGNDLVIGVLPGTGEGGPSFVAATQVTDGSRVEDLLGLAGLPQKEDVDGAHVYGQETANEDSSGTGPEVAVKGDMVVFAESATTLKTALDRQGSGDRLTEGTFDGWLEGLPKDGLVRAGGDLPSAIDALGIEQTSGVPWMAALRSFGLSLDVSGRTFTADAQVKTDPVDAADLPIAAGGSSPRLVPHRRSAGNLDQAQTMRFALDLVRASVPAATFNQIQTRLERAAHGSLGALEDEFGAGLITQLPSGETATRSEVKDPAAVARTLRSLSPQELQVARVAGEASPVADALHTAGALLPALPVPQAGYFPARSTVTPVSGQPNLYELAGPAPRLPLRLGVPGPPRPAAADQFYFGLIGDVFVTAPSLQGAQQAAALKIADLGTPPGAVAFSLPLDTGDVGVGDGSSGPVVKLTTLTGGVQAGPDGLSLRAHAGL